MTTWNTQLFDEIIIQNTRAQNCKVSTVWINKWHSKTESPSAVKLSWNACSLIM